jgi:hypothetical protein
MVAAATYQERLTVGINLRISGAGARTTIVDGGAVQVNVGGVARISSGAHVFLSGMTFRHGLAELGGGIGNYGILTLRSSAVIGNHALGGGGGIWNAGTATINASTISGNVANNYCPRPCFHGGGGVFNIDPYNVNINNSTIAGNSARQAGGIWSFGGTVKVSNSTISGNTASFTGGIYINSGTAIVQNTIVANNNVANCGEAPGAITSRGYNLSSDDFCPFASAGDLNNTDPELGPLQYNGGPTQTMALPSGSPAVDAGNPAGCTNNLGVLLRTDQRGAPRPDTEDTAGCDMGAFERQSD